MDKQIRDIPVRLRMVSRRYAVAASLFETVFRRIAGMSDMPPVETAPEDELMLGIMEDSDSRSGYYVKPAPPEPDIDEQTPDPNSPERLELYTEGHMTVEPTASGAEIVSIHYDESELTGMDGAHTTLLFHTDDAGLVSLMRSGAVTTAMTFRAHCRALCVYETPFMPFQVGIHCLTVDNRLLTDGILKLDYIIEIRGARAERCEMEFSIL